ncbi:MAG: MotA/TolQ/ExbB proton channel family protein [Pseudomonadota bacterium]
MTFVRSDWSHLSKQSTGGTNAQELDTTSGNPQGDGVAAISEQTLDHTNSQNVMGLVEWVIQSGGPVAVLLILISVFALSIILFKFWHLKGVGKGSRKQVEAALTKWRKKDYDAAVSLLSRDKSAVAQITELAMRGVASSGTRPELLKEELTRVATAHMEDLRSHIRTLEIIGTLSPLLGLLGTVLGMIQAFQQLQISGKQVDPAVLSGGIWQALLTTALGLMVAIPVVAASTWLERKIERQGHYINDVVTRVFTRSP